MVSPIAAERAGRDLDAARRAPRGSFDRSDDRVDLLATDDDATDAGWDHRGGAARHVHGAALALEDEVACDDHPRLRAIHPTRHELARACDDGDVEPTGGQ